MKLTLTFCVLLACAFTNTNATPEANPTPTPKKADFIETATETQVKAAKMIDESRKKQADLAKHTKAMMSQSEVLLKRQQEQLDRMDKILATWEKQQMEYQRYLDALPKK